MNDTLRASVSGDDLAGSGWRVLDGVVDTPYAYLFEPLGITIPKREGDTAARMRASGLLSQTGPWWSPGRVHSQHLPPGRLRAVTLVAFHYGRSLIPIAAPPAAIAFAGVCTGARGMLAVGLLGLLVVLSLLVHEAGHVLAFRWVARTAPAIFTTRGADAALVRPPLPTRRESAVVCAGPGAPLMVGFPLVLVWEASWPLAVAWLTISAAHVIALIVPFGDGANLRALLRRPSPPAGADLPGRSSVFASGRHGRG